MKTHICKVVANHTSLRCISDYCIDWTFTNHLPLKSAIIELQFQKKFDPSVANYVLQIYTFVKPIHFGLKEESINPCFFVLSLKQFRHHFPWSHFVHLGLKMFSISISICIVADIAIYCLTASNEYTCPKP